MSKLKLAIAVPIFPNIMQTYILNQLAAFRKMNIDLSIIATDKHEYDPLPPVITDNDLLANVIYVNPSFNNLHNELISIPFLSQSYWLAIRKLISHGKSGQSLNYCLKSLLRVRACTNHHFNVMHSHSLFVTYNYLFIKEVFSIPIITTYHGQVPRGVARMSDSHMKRVFDKADAFIVNTSFAKNELVQLGCDEKKINTIPQGINLENFTHLKKSINIKNKIKLLTVGRLSVEKGHCVAINALSLLSADYPALEYHIVGHGPEIDNLAELTKKLNLRERVIFHGFKTGYELKELFSSSHIFILPSIDTGDGYLVETQGVVLQEAQASGLPVIGSRTGGIPDVIVNNVTGLLFTESDHYDLASKIKRLITEPEFYEKLCLAGRSDVENKYDIDVICNQLISLYQKFMR